MTGRAAIFTGARQPFQFREYPIPEVGPRDLLVKVRMANICGSDIHAWEGSFPGGTFAPGTILGHEMAGEVFDQGERFRTDSTGKPLKVGDRIAYSYFRFCGQCIACLHGDSACPYRYEYRDAGPDQYPHFNGGYAEYFHMDRGFWVFKVPDELSDDLVSPVNCALSEVLYGLHRTGVTLGDTVVIQGVGGLGLYATAVAKEMGARVVIAVDRIAARLELAEEFGADRTLNVEHTSSEERVARIRQWTGGDGADVAVEVSGAPGVIQEGLDSLRQGGRYLWVGNITPKPAEISPTTVVRASRTIFGVVAYEKWVIPRALDLLVRTQAKYPYHKIVSHKFPLDQISEAFPLAAKREVIRVGITM